MLPIYGFDRVTYFFLKGQSFREIYLFYTVVLFSETQVSLCLIRTQTYTFHLNDLASAFVITKGDLSLVQQSQVHKNIGTNFRHQSLICMAHRIHLNLGNLSTSDFFQ